MGLSNNLGKLSNMITSTGSAVGIGTTSPARLLTVYNASADPFISLYGGATNEGGILFGNTSGGDALGQIRYLNGSNFMYFVTNGSERMRITSTGNVGIGTSSPSEKLHIYGTGTNTQALLLESSISSGNAYATFKNTSKFYITGLSADFSNSYIIYDATASAARMTITSGGSVLLGTTTNTSDVRFQVAASGGAASWISGSFAGTGNTDKIVIGNLSSSGPTIGGHNATLSAWAAMSINPGGGAVYAGTLRIDNNSDQRFKKNITSVENALAIILKLQGRKFNMIDEDNILRYGFVAQEVQLHLSDFVTESTREHKDKNVHITNLLTLETSGASWAALLVEAIKEMHQQNQDLKSRLDKAGL